MLELTVHSRRRFSQGLGASLALAAAPFVRPAKASGLVMEVRMSRFSFIPDQIEIEEGDAVAWINDDLAPHTATALDGSWETRVLSSSQNAQLIFETPGDYEYICVFHPHMTGLVSVRSKPSG